jgi:hypothetical protein
MAPKISKKTMTPDQYKEARREYYKAWYQANRDGVIKKVMVGGKLCEVCNKYVKTCNMSSHIGTKKHQLHLRVHELKKQVEQQQQLASQSKSVCVCD